MITPRTLKGFRDYLPAAMLQREKVIATAQRVYRSYGFSPIDTPALEFEEILLGKGGEETDKQMYRFEDAGGRRVGMRFDLTVPLARFAAQHIADLGTPFKRYHIATVWRGENTSRGRYREFMQCDFDTIGTTAVAADIETGLVIHDLFHALGFDAIAIRVNNRQVLTGMLEKLGLADRATAILRALDKLGKIGREKVADEMMQVAGATASQADDVLRLSELKGSNHEVLAAVENLLDGNERGLAGAARLREVLGGMAAAGVPDERVKLDVAIARGLGYYTGVIFETFLDELPDIGSVCSGGRYDNLAELYTKQQLPGIGASLGLDRLLSAMEELGRVAKVATPAPVFIPFFDGARLHDYLRLARGLRSHGLGVEVYPEPKKLGQQLKYADRRGCKLAVILGSQEFEGAKCQVKVLATSTTHEVDLAAPGGGAWNAEVAAEKLAAKLAELLAAG
ncbi:MAG: histidine--tRNA ligase [Planctomycetia bacterium]|nr:histidine--tRNA ligase [Planctomycetia bacterium]